jgi:hypothetical protein
VAQMPETARKQVEVIEGNFKSLQVRLLTVYKYMQFFFFPIFFCSSSTVHYCTDSFKRTFPFYPYMHLYRPKRR